MTLVDTSVWIDHLRRGNSRLAALLASREVVQHPFVTGELALGNLPRRLQTLRHLAELPEAPVVPHERVLDLLELGHLSGLGLGWVDVHLLGSALEAGERLWTLDRVLASSANALGIAA